MTIYEPHVTPDDINRIRERLNKYTLECLHDDGLYRHLHCYWKDDPYGANNCSFHVYTAPYMITIMGDWMDAYTLCRDKDMLDFCNITRSEYMYWAGKLQNRAARASIRAIDEHLFWKELADYLKICTDYSPGEQAAIIEQAHDAIIFDEAYAHPITQLMDTDFELPTTAENGDWNGYKTIPASDIFDCECSFGEYYSHEWIRTCEALRWTANTYKKQTL